MRDIFSSLRYVGNVVGAEVKGVDDIRRDVTESDSNSFVAGLGRQHEPRLQPRAQGKVGSRSSAEKERRKVSQRVLRQSVLMELRCGRDRRRRHQRGSDIVVHIDEKV